MLALLLVVSLSWKNAHRKDKKSCETSLESWQVCAGTSTSVPDCDPTRSTRGGSWTGTCDKEPGVPRLAAMLRIDVEEHLLEQHIRQGQLPP